jgi:hypothetical protein
LPVEQKSRADFAPDIKLPLSKLTATDNIMVSNHGQHHAWKSWSVIMLGNHAWKSCLESKLCNA